MQHLKAISLGNAVPEGGFNATIHSVFTEAVNLRLGKKENLLTLLTINCGDLPQGIRLDTSDGFSFNEILNQNEKMTCREGFLRDEQGNLIIDLNQATRWECKLPFVNMEKKAVRTAWANAWNALDERDKRMEKPLVISGLFRDLGLKTTSARKMISSISGILEGTNYFVIPLFDAFNLIGLGPGLTPSGDDFLVGFLAGLYCRVGEDERRRKFFAAFGKYVNRFSKETNDISRTYLYHATRGQVSSRLVKLAEAISRGESSVNLMQIAEEAMNVGHSSGMETIAGLLLGLSAWTTGIVDF